jgi:hypothetical protein
MMPVAIPPMMRPTKSMAKLTAAVCMMIPTKEITQPIRIVQSRPYLFGKNVFIAVPTAHAA